MSVRPSDLVFFAGGRCLELFGVPFMRLARAQDRADTFTRSGAVGWSMDKDGTFRNAGANRVRPHWRTTAAGLRVPSLLLEVAQTNHLHSSSDHSAAGGDWGAGTGMTQSAATSCIQGQVATRFVNQNTGTSRNVAQTQGVLTAAPETFYAIVEEVDQALTEWGIRDQTVANWVARGRFTWATETPDIADQSLGSGVSVGAYQLAATGPNGGALWLLWVTATPNHAGNGRGLFVYPTGTTQNGHTGIVHHAQHVESIVWTSPIVTGPSAGASRGSELLTLPAGWTLADVEAAGGITVYDEWEELGTAFGGGSAIRYWQRGGDARLLLFGSSSGDGTVTGQLFVNGGASTSSTLSQAVAIGDHVRSRLVLYRDTDDLWKVRLFLSVNGAAELDGGAGTFGSTLPAFDNANHALGSSGTGAQGVAAHDLHLGALGVHTMAEMRNVFPEAA